MLRWGVSVACAALVAAGVGVPHAALAAGAHDALIAKHSAANGVPPSLVRRVIHIESRGNPKIVSKGNYGLMQIRIGTARAMGYTGTPEGLLDADTNMTYAVKYLAGAYRVANGNQERAIAYYQRGYTANAKVRDFTPPVPPFITPPLQPRQILHSEVQPHHPPVPLPSDAAPIPVRPVTTEVIRRPKPSQAELALQQARIAAAPPDPTPVALASPLPRSARAASAPAERAPAPPTAMAPAPQPARVASAPVAERAPAAPVAAAPAPQAPRAATAPVAEPVVAAAAPQPARVAAAPAAERAHAPPLVAAPAPQPAAAAVAPAPQQPAAVANSEPARAAPPLASVAVPLPPVRPAILDTAASAPPAPAAQAAVTPAPQPAAPAPQQPSAAAAQQRAAVANAEPARATTPPTMVNVPLPPVRAASRDTAASAPLAPQTTTAAAPARQAYATEQPSYPPPETIVASRFSPMIESQSAMAVQPVSAQQRSALATQLAARAPLMQPLAPPLPASAPAQVAAPQVTAPQVSAPQVSAPPQVGAPPPAPAAAEPATRTIQLAARPEPQAVPETAGEKEAEPQHDANPHQRHSRRYRRAQPSLLASLGVTTQQVQQPRTRTTRRSSQPTNLLAYLKKAITPDTRTRRRR